MTYQPGERVALVHTDDRHTRLRPGDRGTVRRHDHHLQTVDIDWDNGSSLTMFLNAGDRIRSVTQPAEPDPGTGVGDHGWQQILDAIGAAGTDAGREAAEWWAQDTIGARASGDTAATARRILAGIDDGDPAVLQTLPTVYTGDDADRMADGDVYTAAVGATATPWPALTGRRIDIVRDTYRESFDTAVEDEVAARCRAVACPAGGGRDMSHLHPDRVRVGAVGVFSGDWAWATNDNGEWRIPVGFVGTLIDTWNGWAVFTCTRQVAEAIVADQQRHRDLHRQGLREQGVPEADLDARLDAETTSLIFDGDTIVADQRALYDDPEAIDRIEPDTDGRYVVMGWNWCWEAVDPTLCDRIIGDLPAAGEQQQFVVLPHTGMRVPHERLRVTAIDRRSTHNGTAFTAVLQVDGQPAGTITNDGNGASVLNSTHSQFGPDRMAAYVAACRHHGQPAAAEHVLDALVAEHDLSVRARQADDGGGALVRLLDDGGHILHLLELWPAPRGHTARMNLGRHLNTTHQHLGGLSWQIWSGTAWRHLAQATAPTPDRDQSTAEGGAVTPMRMFAFVIADALLDKLTREQLISYAAKEGIALHPRMTDAQIRAAVRSHEAATARREGLPVDDLPRLSPDGGVELGRRLTARAAEPTGPDEPQQPTDHG